MLSPHILFCIIQDMITDIQIRMAKAALKWSNTDLAVKTGLHKNTLNKAENGEARPATLALIKVRFEEAGLSFPSEYCVCYAPKTEAAD